MGDYLPTDLTTIFWWLLIAVIIVILAKMIINNICMFSAVEGVVLMHGEPVAGATVSQGYKWVDYHKTYKTITDGEGKFSFPPRFRTSFRVMIIPHQPSISQTMTIDFEGKIYDAWNCHKLTYAPNGELKDKELNLIFELNSEPKPHGKPPYSYYGLAKLSNKL